MLFWLFLGGRIAEPLPTGPYAISVMSELELLAYPGLALSEEQWVRAFLADIAVTELTQAIKNHAVDLRKRYSLKLPDAIVAATALALDATLWTNDQRLLALTEVPTRMIPINVPSQGLLWSLSGILVRLRDGHAERVEIVDYHEEDEWRSPVSPQCIPVSI